MTISLTQKSFVRRTSLVALGQGAVKGNQIVVAIVLTRFLAPAVWTQVALLLSVYLAAVTLGSLNLHQSIVFFVPRVGEGSTRALVVQTGVVVGLSGVFIAGGLFAVTPHIGSSFAAASWMPILAVAVLLELPTACASPALVAVDRLGAAAMWDVLTTAVLLAGVLTSVALQPTARSVAWGIAVSAFVRMVAFVVVVGRSFRGRITGLPEGTLRRQLAYGLPLGLTLATSVLNRSIDKWLVALFRPHELGIYTIAAQEVPLLAVLPYAGGAAVVAMVVDSFQRNDRDSAHKAWFHQTASMSMVVVPLSVGLIIVAPEVFQLAFRPEYGHAVLPFQLFTVITTHRVAEYGLVLRAAGRTSALWRSAVVLLLANTAFAAVGVAIGGMVGASIGTVVANAVAWWFVIGQMADEFRVPRRSAFAWGPWFVAVVSSSIAAIVADVVTSVLGGATSIRLVVKLGIFGAVVIALLRSQRGQFVIGRCLEVGAA